MKWLLILFGVLSFSANAADVVKMSSSKICHTSDSASYKRTKNFTAYASLNECLAAGGKLPKNQAKPKQANKVKAGKYERSYFGHGWADQDKDCQNTRAEILIEQSTALVSYKSDDQCLVDKGKWVSLFTGKTIYDAKKVDVDHVVPLKWAWERGADQWSKGKRVEFANDPANLISVEASLNRQKGAKGPAEWLPPGNQCQYILRFNRIVKRYQVSVPRKEAEQLASLKARYCE